ncbi:iron complex transport system permease protein [Actinoplanes campanulatus]|uniref:Iron complex transport system permease protein n=1 Tax=Actinoplanes campanulatus TaxID=113559 RepID=A0A7W5AE35_9ACTN|nr:iron chelate uptake ABC transporter family permease subunit [Actinoplanes campanulatus]MBB3094606.1 iron complex transport system permease protein [Actinoplanes campanulatus]GGN22252.1 iron ABC transporter permease [Actinoplanes campanulatus]GID35477.1 iron ABC transporter permease [Actinoplanes campanulatus]
MRTSAPRRALGLVALCAILAVVAFLSVTQGSRSIDLPEVLRALGNLGGDQTIDSTVTIELRVPRTLLGILAGAALGVAGAILQGVTRNPLADAGIMGINAGAAASVVFAVTVLGIRGIGVSVWFAFAGAAAATVLVYSIASMGREGATPVKLALSGAAVTAGLISVTSAIVMTDIDALNELRFWQVGSLAGRYAPVLTGVAPFLLTGLVLSLGCGRALNGLALGEDVARGLGQRVRLTRAAAFALVALLAGAATAACGPIVFIGLVVPHLARFLCGPDYRWILPYSMLLAPVVLLLADVIGRVAGAPGELQVGVVLAVLCAPVFVGIVRYARLTEA